MELDVLQGVEEGLQILQEGAVELEVLQSIQDLLVQVVDMLWFLGGIGLGIALGWGLIRWLR